MQDSDQVKELNEPPRIRGIDVFELDEILCTSYLNKL